MEAGNPGPAGRHRRQSGLVECADADGGDKTTLDVYAALSWQKHVEAPSPCLWLVCQCLPGESESESHGRGTCTFIKKAGKG